MKTTSKMFALEQKKITIYEFRIDYAIFLLALLEIYLKDHL